MSSVGILQDRTRYPLCWISGHQYQTLYLRSRLHEVCYLHVPMVAQSVFPPSGSSVVSMILPAAFFHPPIQIYWP